MTNKFIYAADTQLDQKEGKYLVLISGHRQTEVLNRQK